MKMLKINGTKKEKLYLIVEYEDKCTNKKFWYTKIMNMFLKRIKHYFQNKKLKNHAFIDANNLYRCSKEQGVKVDYIKLRSWLRRKYNVGKAFLFIGYLKEQENLYNNLKKAGFELTFKEVAKNKDGTVKGNCDADLIVQAMSTQNKYNKAVLISSDGDYDSLVKHLNKENKFLAVVSPSKKSKTSFLLRKLHVPIVYLCDLKKNTIS